MTYLIYRVQSLYFDIMLLSKYFEMTAHTYAIWKTLNYVIFNRVSLICFYCLNVILMRNLNDFKWREMASMITQPISNYTYVVVVGDSLAVFIIHFCVFSSPVSKTAPKMYGGNMELNPKNSLVKRGFFKPIQYLMFVCERKRQKWKNSNHF